MHKKSAKFASKFPSCYKRACACANQILAKRTRACDVRAAEIRVCECACVRGKKSSQLTLPTLLMLLQKWFHHIVRHNGVKTNIESHYNFCIPTISCNIFYPFLLIRLKPKKISCEIIVG